MSVLAPPALFTSDTKSITPPLDDTWAYLEDPHCRPWMAMVLNLNLGDFAGAPGSLADLAYADASGEPLPHAEALGQLLGLMTTLPSELKVGKGKNTVALSPTFKETEEGRRELKTQLVLEPLRSPFEPFHIVGLRLHVLLFHIGRESFPTLTSSLWNLVIRSNEARRAREAARSRSPPINPEPAMASRYVCNVASVGKMWKSLLGDSINGTKRPLEQWVERHGGGVANVTFGEAVVLLRVQLCVHRLSPEWILRLGGPGLLLRAPLETNAEQLDPARYYDKTATSYTFPNPADCLVFAGTTGALHARWPSKLANEIMRAMEELGGAGLSFRAASTPRDEIPVRVNRKRNRDLAAGSEEGESESESESGSEEA